MVTEEMLVYIRSERKRGTTTDILRANLKQGGWDDADIAEAFAVLGTQTIPIPQKPSMPPSQAPQVASVLESVLREQPPITTIASGGSEASQLLRQETVNDGDDLVLDGGAPIDVSPVPDIAPVIPPEPRPLPREVIPEQVASSPPLQAEPPPCSSLRGGLRRR